MYLCKKLTKKIISVGTNLRVEFIILPKKYSPCYKMLSAPSGKKNDVPNLLSHASLQE